MKKCEWEIKNLEEKVDTKMVSLYDYLGKAGGGNLGAQLYEFAKYFNQIIGKRYVNNSSYKGYVRLYYPSTIKTFFELKNILRTL